MTGFALRAGVEALALSLFALLAETAGATTLVRVAQNAQPGARPAPPRGPAAQPPSGQAQAPPGGAQAQQVPTRTEILRFESWIVTCNEFAEGPHTRACSALLQILQPDTNQTVFAWTIAADNGKQMVSVLQTPTGVAIPAGIELRIGKTITRKIPFGSCDPGRCVASTPMDAALLRDLTAALTAEAVIQGSQGNTVQFTIQMKGFDKAMAALSRP